MTRLFSDFEPATRDAWLTGAGFAAGADVELPLLHAVANDNVMIAAPAMARRPAEEILTVDPLAIKYGKYAIATVGDRSGVGVWGTLPYGTLSAGVAWVGWTARGSHTMRRAPPSWASATLMPPWWAVAISRAMARPSPVVPLIRSRSATGIPGPSSATSTTTRCPVTVAVTRTVDVA